MTTDKMTSTLYFPEKYKVTERVSSSITLAQRKTITAINKFDITGMGYLPRWGVLLLDMAIVLLAGLFTFSMLRSVGLLFVNESLLVSGSVIYLVTNLLFFRIFEIYSGIIRHSSVIDGAKIFLAQFATFAALIIVNSILVFESSQHLFLPVGLFVNAVFTSLCLFSYRVLVKHIFLNYTAIGKSQILTRTIIIGTNANAISIATALNSENPQKFKIVGFIDLSSNGGSKRILNLPLCGLDDDFLSIMNNLSATAVIVADANLKEEIRTRIIDDSLLANFKIYKPSLVADWKDQKGGRRLAKFQIEDLLERNPIVLDNKSISQDIQGKVVMVTGAAGSIGSEIVRQVLKFNPERILVLDQAETPLHSLHLEVEKLNPSVQISPVIADIRDHGVIEQVFNRYRPEIVYHAAAYKHVPIMEENPSQAIFTNVMGTKNLADLAVKYQVNKFVMVSTDKAVNPSSVMGASKRIAEKYVQSLFSQLQKSKSNHTKFITTRFGNVLGSNGSVVPLFTKQIENGEAITITHPDIIRYFMTIPEACQLVLEAGTMGKGGEIFIFDMGKPVKIMDLAMKMIRLAGLTPGKDIEIKITGLRPGEKLYEELLNDSAKTLPTHHEKIMIAQDVLDEFSEVLLNVDELIKTSKTSDSLDIVRKMKAIVPEYKSMNSAFQKIDNGQMVAA